MPSQMAQPILKPVMSFMGRKIRAKAKQLGVRYSFFFMTANGNQLNQLAQLVDQGKLKPLVHKAIELGETDLAFNYQVDGKARGKVVIIRS